MGRSVKKKRSKTLSFYGEQLLAPQITSLRSTHFRLYATSYSASVSRTVHPQPEDSPYLRGRDTLNHEFKNLSVKTYKTKNVLVIAHDCDTFYLSLGEES